ncbi:MAG TPA: hypothetical protein VN328_01715 [Thermodesulfovibrionales bacterium]|nr:hypothetical protein [Thermodesulfovibrionales bacterium]
MPEVLVKLQNGDVLNGNIQSFNPNLPAFYLHTVVDEGKSLSVTVRMDSVKAVFFLKKEMGDDSVVHMETIEQSTFAGTLGFRLHVEFNDGELIHGSTHKYSSNDKGFYLVPLNPADRYERIYVNALATKRVDSRRLMGKILIDQKKITEPQLDQALKYQREKKEKKIGAILREHDLITQEQLEESLQKQTERTKYLGEILLEAGYITEEQLQGALHIQMENKKKRLGQILVELKYISPNDICIALATQFHLPWADLSTFKIPAEIAAALPEEVIRSLEAMPVERKDDTLRVASADPQDPGLKEKISRYTKLNIELVVAYEGYIETAINRLFPKKE